MWKVFPFNNYFLFADESYTPEQMWDLTLEHGYDKLYVSVNRNDESSWNVARTIRANRKRTGLGLAAAYVVVDLNDPNPDGVPSIEDVMDQLDEGDILELALKVGWKESVSDPALDPKAIALLEHYLPMAKSRGLTILLYHHIGFYAERFSDCVRVAKRIDDPNLGVTFCGYHWYAADQSDLLTNLQSAGSLLKLVNVCGSRKKQDSPDAPLKSTIEVVGAGDFPLHEFIRCLREVDYTGDVGFQGYKLSGHAPSNLKTSIEAWKRAVSEA